MLVVHGPEDPLLWIDEMGLNFVHRDDDHLTDLEDNLERLTLDIPDAVIDDLPMR